MAEFIFKDMLKENGLDGNFTVSSAATNPWGVPSPINPSARRKLLSVGIDPGGRVSQMLCRMHGEQFDYIIGMDHSNLDDMRRILGCNSRSKIYRLLEFDGSTEDIADPYYTGDFDQCYRDICRGLTAFLDYLRENNLI